jgi:hypothetical protein
MDNLAFLNTLNKLNKEIAQRQAALELFTGLRDRWTFPVAFWFLDGARISILVQCDDDRKLVTSLSEQPVTITKPEDEGDVDVYNVIYKNHRLLVQHLTH